MKDDIILRGKIVRILLIIFIQEHKWQESSGKRSFTEKKAPGEKQTNINQHKPSNKQILPKLTFNKYLQDIEEVFTNDSSLLDDKEIHLQPGASNIGDSDLSSDDLSEGDTDIVDEADSSNQGDQVSNEGKIQYDSVTSQKDLSKVRGSCWNCSGACNCYSFKGFTQPKVGQPKPPQVSSNSSTILIQESSCANCKTQANKCKNCPIGNMSCTECWDYCVVCPNCLGTYGPCDCGKYTVYHCTSYSYKNCFSTEVHARFDCT